MAGSDGGERDGSRTGGCARRARQPFVFFPVDAPVGASSGHKKRAALRPLFVSSLGKDYLRILRRRTIASAPRPSRPIVAGSGTGSACVVPLTTRLLAPEKPNDVAAPVGEAK